ncbi:anti-sigma factor antagonist, partial [bacterium]|nr:anti-sigma factor antagonist [bacterium]
MLQHDLAHQTAVLTPEGDLDAASVESFRRTFRDAIGDGCQCLTLDLSNTQFMCSAALGALMEAYSLLNRKGGSLKVVNLRPPIKRLLRETKLLDMLTADESLEEDRIRALEAVQEQMSEELLFLSHINTITSNILQTQVPDRVYEQTLEAVHRALKPKRAMILLLSESEEGRVYRIAASTGFGQAAEGRVRGMIFRPDTFEGKCLREEKARLFGPDAPLNGDRSPLLEALAAGEGYLGPIVGRRGMIGLVVVEASHNASAFFLQSAPLLQVFANICGLAAEKQQLLEDIRYKNDQLSRTLTDLHRAQDTLVEAGKLAVMAAMVRGITHTLNNKLVPIMGYA